MTKIATGTVLITGPTGGLGRAATLAMASRDADQRPDLVLVGRGGPRLTEVAEAARAAGAVVREVPADLSSLTAVRAAVSAVKALVSAGEIRPLRAIVGNAGISTTDTHRASADGYELTYAVNFLAHAQLIDGLLDVLETPARIVLLGSNTYYENRPRRMLRVPAANWRDPHEIARPVPLDQPSGIAEAGVAYSDSKLAILYYAHELQRHVKPGIAVSVFEPGFMPGTGLSREHGERMQRVGRAIQRIPGVSSPVRSGPLLASVVLDDRWSHLRDGAFVVKDRERQVEPFAIDRAREAELWEATRDMLTASATATGEA